MPSDAHVHPYYLARCDGGSEQTRRDEMIHCAASAFHEAEFCFNEALMSAAQTPAMAVCFGVHPQLPAHNTKARLSREACFDTAQSLDFLQKLIREKRIDALGEIGFDLYDGFYKTTESEQDVLFKEQLVLALEAGLPVVLHVRRALHKIFTVSRELRRLPAVVFHAYGGPLDEARALLRRGINAFFSFGAALTHNHKHALCTCARLESSRLLFETDAPYQPLAGRAYSSYCDVYTIIEAAARLRGQDAKELINMSDATFKRIFLHRPQRCVDRGQPVLLSSIH
jgi:TatD DNase family protein